MWKCIRCNKDNQDSAEKCINCGHGKTMDYTGHRSVSRLRPEMTENWKKKKEKPMLMADCMGDDEAVFGSKLLRREVCEIDFVKMNLASIPSGAWDVSEDQDKTIWAWKKETPEGYILYIGSEKGVYANENCEDLFCCYVNVKKINFHNLFDTSRVTNMAGMFYHCKSLIELDINNFDTRNVTDMRRMFDGCKNLKSLDVSRFDVGNVEDMVFMFSECESLEELDVSRFDTRNVTDMYRMFDECKSLKSLDVSRFDVGNVEDMSYMFWGCESLEELDVGKFKTDKVKDMSGMFGGCKNLKNLNVSRFDVGNVEDMGYMFHGCESLEELDVGEFKTDKVKNMHSMFGRCKNLKSLNVSRFDTRNVTDMSYMFSGCENLVDLDISNFYFGKDVKFEDMFKDSAMAEVYDEKAIQELYRKDNPEKSVPEKASSIKSVSIDEKILDELDELWLKKSEALLHQKRFIVHNHNQLDKRKNKRIYEANSIEGIVRKFLEYKENRPVNNGQKKKKLINALQIGADDKIYLLHDYSRSIFSSGKYGFALTDKGIYLASPWKMSKFISWKIFQEASAIDTGCLGFDVTIDRGETITYNGLDEEIALQLEMMFIAIYKLLNAEKDIFIDW